MWDNAEFGAPAVDPKRPYGNSDVIGDIASILRYEITIDADDDHEASYEAEDEEAMTKAHSDLVKVLDIACQNLAFPEPGSVWKRSVTGEWSRA